MPHPQGSGLFKPSPKGIVYYSLNLLLSDLGPSGFLHLFPSSIHISSLSYSLPWCLPQRWFFSCPHLSFCWQVHSLSVDSAIPLFHSLTLYFPCPLPSSVLSPQSMRLKALVQFPFPHSLALSSVVASHRLCGLSLTLPSSVHPSSASSQLSSALPVFPVLWWGPVSPSVSLWGNSGVWLAGYKDGESMISPAPNGFILPSLKREKVECPLLPKSMVMAAHLTVKMLPGVIGSCLSLGICPAPKAQSFWMNAENNPWCPKWWKNLHPDFPTPPLERCKQRYKQTSCHLSFIKDSK